MGWLVKPLLILVFDLSVALTLAVPLSVQPAAVVGAAIFVGLLALTCLLVFDPLAVVFAAI